jgi:hypothetical protein
VISPRIVATKWHNNDLLISLTSLVESGTDLHEYLLTSEGFKDKKQLVLHAAPPALHAACVQMGTSMRHRWRPMENLLLAIFFMLLSKRETRISISTTSLVQNGTDTRKYLLT